MNQQQDITTIPEVELMAIGYQVAKELARLHGMDANIENELGRRNALKQQTSTELPVATTETEAIHDGYERPS